MGDHCAFADLKKHERECLFRKVLCPGAYCELEVPFNKVVEHARGPRRDKGRDRRRPWVDKYGPPTRTDYRLIIENLSTRVSWQDLKDLMRRAGEVTYANAHNDNRNEG